MTLLVGSTVVFARDIRTSNVSLTDNHQSLFKLDPIQRQQKCQAKDCNFEAIDFGFSTDFAPFIRGTPTIEEFFNALKTPDPQKAVEDLGRQFAEAYLANIEVVCNNQECPKCDALTLFTKMTGSDSSLPPFIFFGDPANFIRKDNVPHVFFPSRLSLYNRTYVLHARVFSTARTGGHFYTVARVMTDGPEQAMVEIDNLKEEFIEIRRNISFSHDYCVYEDISNQSASGRGIYSWRNTLFVCYRLLEKNE